MISACKKEWLSLILLLFFSVGWCGGEHGGQSGGVQGRNGSDHLHVQIGRRDRRHDHTVVLCEFHQAWCTHTRRGMMCPCMWCFMCLNSDLQVTRLGEKHKIYYQDSTAKVVDRGTPFTDRISVNGTGATGEVVLTISSVQLEDELEFICLIKGLTDGTGEGRTKLKVFGKIQPVIACVVFF